jgi:hypothetical protein
MTREEKIAFKDSLKQFCQTLIEQRIQTTKALIDNAQQAANSEEKSSAGDKYETARAMGHLEKDMHTRQLMENVKELAGLQNINTHEIYSTVTTGAFVQCSSISLFIAAGAGKQVFNGQSVLFLSPGAPLAQLIKNKKAGDSFSFKGVNTIITALF